MLSSFLYHLCAALLWDRSMASMWAAALAAHIRGFLSYHAYTTRFGHGIAIILQVSGPRFIDLHTSCFRESARGLILLDDFLPWIAKPLLDQFIVKSLRSGASVA